MKIIKIFLPQEDLDFLGAYQQTKIIEVVEKIIFVRAFYTPNSNLFFEFTKNGMKYYCWNYGVVNDYSESLNDCISFADNTYYLKITDSLYNELIGV